MANSKKIESVKFFESANKENKPENLLCDGVISVNDLIDFFEANKEFISVYTDKDGNNHKQFKISAWRTDYGTIVLYLNTYKKEQEESFI